MQGLQSGCNFQESDIVIIKYLKVPRKSKSYSEHFYQTIMDESVLPINNIWISESSGRSGIYVGILYGQQNNDLRFKALKDGWKHKDY